MSADNNMNKIGEKNITTTIRILPRDHHNINKTIKEKLEQAFVGKCYSGCYIISIEGITKTWHDVSHISKWGGGIGIHVSNIRSKGSDIRSTNGHSDGIIPMLQVYNAIARYINQCFTPDTPIFTDMMTPTQHFIVLSALNNTLINNILYI